MTDDYCGIVVMDDTDELLALGKGITEGEWRVGIWLGDVNRAHCVAMGSKETTFAMLRPASEYYHPASAIVHSDGDRCQVEANARAIAAVPRLFARVEQDAATIAELRAEVARLRETLDMAAGLICVGGVTFKQMADARCKIDAELSHNEGTG